MKATVLESACGKSIVLAEDGMFYSTVGDYRIGETIEYNAEQERSRYVASKKRSIIKIAASVAACLLLVISGISYSFQNLMVYADVTLEGKMAVKCRLNRNCEVIKIESVDESGKALAEDMSENGMKGQDIDSALKYAKKYIRKHLKKGEKTRLYVVVSCKDKDEKQKMTKELNEKFAGETGKPDDQVSVSEAGDEQGSGETASGGSDAVIVPQTQTETKPSDQGETKPADTTEPVVSGDETATPADEQDDDESDDASGTEEGDVNAQDAPEETSGEEVGTQELSIQEEIVEDATESDSASGEKAEKVEKPEKSEKPEKAEKPEQTDEAEEAAE